MKESLVVTMLTSQLGNRLGELFTRCHTARNWPNGGLNPGVRPTLSQSSQPDPHTLGLSRPISPRCPWARALKGPGNGSPEAEASEFLGDFKSALEGFPPFPSRISPQRVAGLALRSLSGCGSHSRSGSTSSFSSLCLLILLPRAS